MAGKDSLEADVAQWLYPTRVFVGLWCRARRTPNYTGCSTGIAAVTAGKDGLEADIDMGRT